MEAMGETNPLQHPPKFVPSSSSKEAKHVKQKQPQQPKRKKQFPSHLDTSNVSQEARTLCEILTNSSVHDVEAALDASRVAPLPETVQEVLKLSYGSSSAAIKFFRWAGLTHKHSVYSWNLMVDLLGKNELFEPMWDAIRSMKQEKVLSLATFVSAFGSYCMAGRFNEVFMTFDVMERYGIQPDVVAVNSLLSAICSEDNQTARAKEFFERIKGKIALDGDTFAILLEGWEKEANTAEAKRTFGEMVVVIGWNQQNLPTYEAFLTMLFRASQADDAVKFLQVMMKQNCLPGLKFFTNALDILIKLNDSFHAIVLWDLMVGSGLVPNLVMYNAVICLVCNKNEIEYAFRFLDEMVFYGAFPDSLTYNMIFHCLIKNKKVCEAGKFFHEMIKNEWPPTHTNCAAAIAMLFEGDEPEVAIEIWDYMIENHVSPLDESANALLLGLRKLRRLSEVRRFANDMLDRRIEIYESTMSKLENAFSKEGRNVRDSYDSIYRRWRAS